MLRSWGVTSLTGPACSAVAVDVGIRDGRIVAIGTQEDAHRRVDATGKVVSPGFIDVHTHFDAQIVWDPYLTPSPLHGVTTAIGGNCGFTLAPMEEHAATYLTEMLARVEGIPLETIRAGVDITWRTFEEYLALNGRKRGDQYGLSRWALDGAAGRDG